MRIVCAILLCLLTACATRPLARDQVRTTQGIVQGITVDGITSYLGIEYARAERWQLPGDAPRWDGVRAHDRPGPACPQMGQDPMVEDCLFLNVFAPSETARDARLPVLIWFHGGGLRAGRGDERMRFLAQDGVLVVSFNYRLGLLGFRDWPGWSARDPRNFGQADMVKALEWVNANAARFGGDAGNITIAGHSAGGMGVQLMMVDPRARGLFQRAISDAGYGSWPFPTAMNPTPEQHSRIRYAALETDLTAAELVARVPYFHLPVVGGSDLPRQPVEAFERGEQARVPYVAGANSYDGFGIVQAAGWTTSTFLGLYADQPALRATYADDFAVSDDQAAARIFGDMRYVFASWATVRAMAGVDQPAYLFHFREPSEGLPGAAHGAQFAGFGPQPFALKDYYLAFIKTGKPMVSGLPAWPAYRDDAPVWMVFDGGATPTDAAMEDKMRVLQELQFPQPIR